MNISEYKQLLNEYEALRTQLVLKGRETFQTAAQEIFDSWSDLEYFSWAQYTPYFNDGDECHFGVHSDYFKIKMLSAEEEVDTDELYYLQRKRGVEESDPPKDLVRDIGVLLGLFGDHLFKEWFGDHVRVIANRTGVSVEGYDHD